MTNYREILRLGSQGVSQRQIARSCECSRTTVGTVLEKAKKAEIAWPLEEDITNAMLYGKLFNSSPNLQTRTIPDFEYIHRELARAGVNLKLLWSEYCLKCRNSNESPLMYSQFCYHYQQFNYAHKATMHIKRKPGEQIEVDWAGQKAIVIDRETGEMIDASVFVGVLSSSKYAYVEAFLSQNLENWLTAHVNMFNYFGGVAKILIPDNLKTGVTKASWYTPEINRSYQEMAEYYGTAVIPARVRKPKDKPAVEGAVGNTSTWIIAALRNQQFFSLKELNEAIHEKLEIFNQTPFQKKPGNRYSTFIDEEKQYLLLLPKSPYELATWRVATVQFNYHIAIEKNYYSVPSEYIKQQVDVRLTNNTVEIFQDNNRICAHVRIKGRTNNYSTSPEHMPSSHRKYQDWDAERFIQWGKDIGSNTETVIRSILSHFKVEQQGYRSCMALLKLTTKYSAIRVEAACAKALTFTLQPGFKTVQLILNTEQDKKIADNNTAPTPTGKGFVRGSAYYGGKPQC